MCKTLARLRYFLPPKNIDTEPPKLITSTPTVLVESQQALSPRVGPRLRDPDPSPCSGNRHAHKPTSSELQSVAEDICTIWAGEPAYAETGVNNGPLRVINLDTMELVHLQVPPLNVPSKQDRGSHEAEVTDPARVAPASRNPEDLTDNLPSRPGKTPSVAQSSTSHRSPHSGTGKDRKDGQRTLQEDSRTLVDDLMALLRGMDRSQPHESQNNEPLTNSLLRSLLSSEAPASRDTARYRKSSHRHFRIYEVPIPAGPPDARSRKRLGLPSDPRRGLPQAQESHRDDRSQWRTKHKLSCGHTAHTTTPSLCRRNCVCGVRSEAALGRRTRDVARSGAGQGRFPCHECTELHITTKLTAHAGHARPTGDAVLQAWFNRDISMEVAEVRMASLKTGKSRIEKAIVRAGTTVAIKQQVQDMGVRKGMLEVLEKGYRPESVLSDYRGVSRRGGLVALERSAL